MKVIQTRWKGTSYRSRLEARWAVVFDFMGWSYIYEPEGFEHCGEVYLPDFWIEDWKAYVAVKPTANSMELLEGLHRDLRFQSDMIACGLDHYTIEGHPIRGKCRIHIGNECETAVLADCRRCNGTNYITEDGFGNITKCCDTDKWPDPEHSDRINAAFDAAMACKFGEDR
jgi:hypothetical protein